METVRQRTVALLPVEGLERHEQAAASLSR